MSKINEITVVGCGAMGGKVIDNFLKGGYHVVIVDLNKDLAKPFIEKGAEYSSSLQEAPETQTIFMLMPSHKIAKSVLESCTKERLEGKYLINGTTCGPKDVLDMAETTEKIGMDYLEAKIQTSPDWVGRETGYMLYSGSKKVMDEMEHILRELGEYEYLGDNPRGAALLDISGLNGHFGLYAALIEAAAFCLKNDFNPAQLKNHILRFIPGVAEDYWNGFEELWKHEFPDFDGAPMWIERRGLKMCKDAMNASGVNTIFDDWLLSVFDKAIEDGLDKKRMTAIVKQMIEY